MKCTSNIGYQAMCGGAFSMTEFSHVIRLAVAMVIADGLPTLAAARRQGVSRDG